MSDSPLRDKPTAKELVPFIVGAKGHMALAAERATRTLGVKVTEYDVIEIRRTWNFDAAIQLN